MPRLSGELAGKAQKAAESGGSFEPLEPGPYRARLAEVTARTSSNNNPMWTWVFEVCEGPHTGRRQWVNTALTDNAMWKVGEVFRAFGVPSDTDTDEMIGATVVLDVIQREIESGSRAGQIGNDVREVSVDKDPRAVRVPGAEFTKKETAGAGAAKAAPAAVASRRDDY